MPVTQQKLFEKRATSQGSYWVSPLSKHAIRHVLRGYEASNFKTAGDVRAWWENDADLRAYLKRHNTSDFAKEAAIGGEQEAGFEQAFSSLAYAYTKDKAPRLIDFIVGFQLVERNEDNTKAVGIFGFKVGDQWLYAPVFFLNGDLKGHELLYIKKQDTFVPMKENWVNYLISRKPHVLGEGSPQNTQQLGGMMPNLSRLSRQPSGGYKSGADANGSIYMESWVHPALPAIFAMATKQATGLYGGVPAGTPLNFDALVLQPFKAAAAETARAFDLRTALTLHPVLKRACLACADAYPRVKAGLDKFYGPNFFAELDAHQDSLVKRAESFIIPPKKKKPAATGLSIIPQAEPEKQGELTIIALDVSDDAIITDNRPELTDEEREKLLNDTILIKDERDDGRKSIAYNTQVRMELVNPDETGLYEVLEKPGTFAEMVVISNPHTGRGRENFTLVVRKSSPKNWKNTHRANLWVQQSDCPTKEDWTKYVEGLDGSDSLAKGGVYIAVHANGSGTCPFRVRESFGEGVYSVEWKDHVAYGERPSATTQFRGMDDRETGYSSYNARVYINARKGTKLQSVNGELSIPDSYKIIKVAAPPKPKSEDGFSLISCCGIDGVEDSQSEDAPVQPGNLIDVQLSLHKKAAVLKVFDHGSSVTLTAPGGVERQLSKKAALVSLVRRHGLAEKQARAMLKEAAAGVVHNRDAKFLIKYADGYGMMPGPDAPAIPEPQYGTEQVGYGSVHSQYPQEEELPVDGMSSQYTDPSIYDPFYMPDQNAMQVAQQASSSGQKEVFDTAMIGGMLKAVRQDSLVDRYLGDLMKALDKLGRILFMFYWHQEEFEDRYGKNDLPELEDSLRNAFEVLGDVCLFLKEKTVQGASGIDIGSGVGGQSEPDVTEAARN